jgi:hypothetical protein
MKRLFPVLLFAVALLSSAGTAIAVTVVDLPELAPGLRYLRIHSLVQSAHELSDAISANKSPALVIDLRYVADETGAAEAISALDKQPVKPVLYLLVNPATPAKVAAAITKTTVPLVTLGIRNSRPQPQVIVEQSAADDRAAYAALDNGTPIAALASGKIDKERFDEAELVKEFKNGNHDAHPTEGNADGAKTQNRLTDRVLQRALHLHQALLALKGT